MNNLKSSTRARKTCVKRKKIVSLDPFVIPGGNCSFALMLYKYNFLSPIRFFKYYALAVNPSCIMYGFRGSRDTYIEGEILLLNLSICGCLMVYFKDISTQTNVLDTYIMGVHLNKIGFESHTQCSYFSHKHNVAQLKGFYLDAFCP